MTDFKILVSSSILTPAKLILSNALFYLMMSALAINSSNLNEEDLFPL